jgi:C4-dicarboxylate transporter DctM subunit
MSLNQSGIAAAKRENIFLRQLAKVESLGVSISGILIVFMMALTTLDTFLRQVFNKPIPGVYELESMMLVAIVFLGLAFVQGQKRHINLDIISTHLKGSFGATVQLLSQVIFLLVAVLITWQMGIQAWNAWITGDYFYGIVHFPLWPPKTLLTLGTALLGIRVISDIIRNPLWSNGSMRNRIMGVITAIIVLGLILAGLIFVDHLDLAKSAVGYIVIGLFLITLFLGVPVGPAMALTGIIGFWIMLGKDSALGTAGTVPFSATSEYVMTVMPLFVVMGALAGLAGFAEKGFDLAKRWLEPIKGGIVHATVVGSTIFAAATGSGAAACAVLTKLTMPEMLRNGVQKGLAIGVIASAASLAIMIPPSTSFVIYGMLTGNSVGRLLIGGIVPGLLGAVIISIMVYLRCKFDPSLVGAPPTIRSTWKERFIAIPSAWGIALVVLVIIGGIMTGYFTPTEAGAVGAFVTLIAAVSLRKSNLRTIWESVKDSAGVTGMIMFILVGGLLFGNLISLSQIPVTLSNWVAGLDMPPILFLISVMIIYFFLGCFLDAMSIMIITLPIIYPIIISLGFDPIWFGVLQVQNLEIAAITPPYGMNLFILKSLMPGTSMGEIIKGSFWFVIPLVATMILYIAWPDMVLWLPNLMSK